MTHQTGSLGKYWKLFPATLKEYLSYRLLISLLSVDRDILQTRKIADEVTKKGHLGRVLFFRSANLKKTWRICYILIFFEKTGKRDRKKAQSVLLHITREFYSIKLICTNLYGLFSHVKKPIQPIRMAYSYFACGSFTNQQQRKGVSMPITRVSRVNHANRTLLLN